MSDDENETHVIQDQPYDESLDVGDTEEVPSVYTPVPNNRRLPESLGSPRNDFKRANYLALPAPDSNMTSGVAHISRERPIQQQHRQNDSPDDSPRPDNNDDTQDEDDSDPPSSQILNGGVGGGGGQKEYKSPDTNAYDPKIYQDLPVSAEVKDIFKYIEKYQPQDIVLDTKLKPFIPEFVPAIGDIDAFLKVPRPDGKEDHMGLIVLDEPSSKQSDPHVLNLQMRYTSKQPMAISLPTNVRSVTNADKNPKAIEEWIHNISKLQKAKTGDTVQYRKPMPDIDGLMQEWPTQFEELLKETSIPSADIDADLETYTDIACSLLDIPVYESRVQSLHALFTLYLGFKNSEHFKAIMDVPEQSNRRVGNHTETDQMIID